MPKIECNKIVLGQMEIVKPELINLGTFQSFFPDNKIDILGINCQILRDWIHLHIPKHEDGNNFGVEVQEEALQELQAVKEESQSQGSTDRIRYCGDRRGKTKAVRGFLVKVLWKNMLHIIWPELISWKRFFKKEILKI